jgi:prefoldin subunit 5
MHLPSVEQLGAELEALEKHAEGLPAEANALVEQLAKLQALAVYLNASLAAPTIEEV